MSAHPSHLDLLTEPRLPVFLLTPRWSEFVLSDPTLQDLCFAERGAAMDDPWTLYVRAFIGGDCMPFDIPVRRGAYELGLDGSVRVFGLRKLGPGTWRVEPSVNIPELLHVFLVLCEVPEPAPWEKR